MKNVLITILTMVALANFGCASKKEQNPASSQSNTAESADESADESVDSSIGEAPFKFTSLSTAGDYAGHSLNSPKNIYVKFDLYKYGKGYGGDIFIGYTDNGVDRLQRFTSLVSTNNYPSPPISAADTNAENNKYNKWFVKNGQSHWHGHFEDRSLRDSPFQSGDIDGGIIVVIDQVADLGDGSSEDLEVSGSIYFKNFGITSANQSNTSCWFLSEGPYQCRGKPSGLSGGYTAGGYRKLGTFTNLNLKAGFNNEAVLP